MEYVVVIYPGDRSVLIDGQFSGHTNSTLIIQEGNHQISLETLDDFEPGPQDLQVSGTTPMNPMEVTFWPKGRRE